MRAVVVFESMFGNTQKIADAVAEGLSGYVDTDLVEVGSAGGLDEGVALVVAGGPTHVHGLSRPGTRDGAVKQAPDGVVSKGIGLREWLESLPQARGIVSAAAFDTRFDKPGWLVGSAARGAARRLRRRGYRLVVPPESFFVVAASSGPLADGEVERARRWGKALGAAVAPADRGRQVS